MSFLSDAFVDPAVHARFPDYRANLVLAENLTPGPSDPDSEKPLAEAEARYRGGSAPRRDQHPHILAWREAFRAFGAKPQQFRPSVEALLRRVPDGLPRINRLTDLYNAVSVAHLVPIGGEDVDAYRGPLRLIEATGEETFDTVAGGEPTMEHPLPGEIVWRDDVGVTCRRWNWRQCVRTRLTTETTRAVFLFDALAGLSDAELAPPRQRWWTRCATPTPASRSARGRSPPADPGHLSASAPVTNPAPGRGSTTGTASSTGPGSASRGSTDSAQHGRGHHPRLPARSSFLGPPTRLAARLRLAA